MIPTKIREEEAHSGQLTVKALYVDGSKWFSTESLEF
jgi:hypothetical protein